MHEGVNIDKDKLIDILSEELPVLRVKIGLTQGELCELIGISRQTYSAIETKKRKMSWNVFLSLLMFFAQNDVTAPIIDEIGAFPEELKQAMNVDNRANKEGKV